MPCTETRPDVRVSQGSKSSPVGSLVEVNDLKQGQHGPLFWNT